MSHDRTKGIMAELQLTNTIAFLPNTEKSDFYVLRVLFTVAAVKNNKSRGEFGYSCTAKKSLKELHHELRESVCLPARKVGVQFNVRRVLEVKIRTTACEYDLMLHEKENDFLIFFALFK